MNTTAFTASPRHIFVSMLFALAVGGIAKSGYGILLYVSAKINIFDNEVVRNLVIYQSLQWFLALFVILTSWVDWTNSFSEGVEVEIKIVSKEFILLVLDVCILFAYFHLISMIDMTETDAKSILLTQSASCMAIFALYILWDLIHYVINRSVNIFIGLMPSVLLFLYMILMANLENRILMTLMFILGVIIFRLLHSLRLKLIANLSPKV